MSKPVYPRMDLEDALRAVRCATTHGWGVRADSTHEAEMLEEAAGLLGVRVRINTKGENQ